MTSNPKHEPVNEDVEREAFEVWLNANYPYEAYDPLFEAWQARAAAVKPPKSETVPCDCDDGVDWSTGESQVCAACNGAGCFYVAVKPSCVSPVSDKTGCGSENGESETQGVKSVQCECVDGWYMDGYNPVRCFHNNTGDAPTRKDGDMKAGLTSDSPVVLQTSPPSTGNTEQPPSRTPADLECRDCPNRRTASPSSPLSESEVVDVAARAFIMQWCGLKAEHVTGADVRLFLNSNHEPSPSLRAMFSAIAPHLNHIGEPTIMVLNEEKAVEIMARAWWQETYDGKIHPDTNEKAYQLWKQLNELSLLAAYKAIMPHLLDTSAEKARVQGLVSALRKIAEMVPTMSSPRNGGRCPRRVRKGSPK